MIDGIPVYEIVVEYDDETGMLRNSLVKNPAVEYERLAFSKVEDIKLFFENNDTEQKFMSISMVADTPILRQAKDGSYFYVRFSKDVIKKIVNKLVMENKINDVSYQHEESQIVDGIYLVEHFFIEKGRVESPLFDNAPDGSWVTTYFVPDKKKYEALRKDKNFRGFSVELDAKIQEAFTGVINDEKLEKEIRDIAFDETLSEQQKEAQIKKVLNRIELNNIYK